MKGSILVAPFAQFLQGGRPLAHVPGNSTAFSVVGPLAFTNNPLQPLKLDTSLPPFFIIQNFNWSKYEPVIILGGIIISTIIAVFALDNFNISFVLAFRKQLESESGIIVREVPIKLATPFDEDWRAQERAISSTDALTADAIVLIPAVTTDDLTERVVQLQKVGIFIVLCDHKMTNQRFFERNMFPPSIVMPNRVSGGKLIGGEMAAVSKNPHEPIIVLTGPSFSGPGTIKSEACIRELVRAAKSANLHLLELKTWHPVDSANLFMNFVKNELPTKLNLTDDQDISVFCGNDEICREIDKQLSNTANMSAYRWRLFGYDGIKDNAGTYILDTCRYASGTIDQKTEELGVQAANVLIDKYRGINSVRRRKIVVEPELVAFSRSNY